MTKQVRWFIFCLLPWMVLVPLRNSALIGAPLLPGEQEQKGPGFLFLSDEMKQFLDSHIMTISNPKERMQTLIENIFDRSVLNFEYSNQQTYTAAESFNQRTGNCLSYTAMFVVMARYAGLKAHFQEVQDFSTWSRRGDLVMFNLHINALVEVEGRRYEVDFDFSTEKKVRRARVVDDLRAQAHYYNNVGAEALVEKNYPLAESLLNRAIRVDPRFSPPWTNLGLLYRFRGDYSRAEASCQKAMSLDKQDYTAQANLVSLYKLQGRIKEAEKLSKQLQSHYEKNPFYHFSQGQAALAREEYKTAVKHFKRAMRREPGEPEFYARLAAAYFNLGNYKAVEKYLKKAGKLAKSTQQRTLYSRKLNYLYSHVKIKE